MTHRAEQVIDAIVSLIPSDDQAVYKHRRRSFNASDKKQKIPAVSVDMAEDAAFDEDGAVSIAFVDSLLSVETTAFARAAREEDLIAELVRMRTQIHKALLSGGRDLGLSSFVIDTRYAGADAPAIDAGSEFLSGRLTSRWLVHYRMNITDPE